MPTKSNRDWAVMFDLDETVVLSGALEGLRRRRAWGAVRAAFGQTHLPGGTLEFIRSVRKIAQLGIVTKAPRRYAEQLLAFHGIKMPVLAAYHDVKKIKPNPEALLLASQKLGIDVSRCIYVGDDANDVRSAGAANVFPIGVCWGKQVEIGLSLVCKSWDEVYAEIVRLIHGSDELGYITKYR